MTRLVRLLMLVVLGCCLSLGIHWLPGVASAPLGQVQLAPQAMVQAGKAAYDAQQYIEAYSQLQQAVQAYKTAGDDTAQAQALGLQSLVLQKLGRWEDAQTAIDQGLTLLASQPNPSQRIRAQVLNAQGHLYLGIGQAREALESWEAAEQDYVAVGETVGAIGSRTNQIQAMQSMGLYRRAGLTLDALETELQTLEASSIQVTGLLSLGNLLRLRGELARSQTILRNGLAVASALGLDQETSQFYLSLGNTERILAARSQALNLLEEAQSHRKTALNYYQSALAIAPSRLTKSQAQLNQLSLLLDDQQLDRAVAVAAEIHQSLGQIPPSRAAVYAQVNFANSLIGLADQTNPAEALPIGVPQLLEQTLKQAESLKDERAITYAEGTLGTWYEHQRDWTTAKTWTTKALQKAQSIRAPDVAYQWQWQMGRLLQAEFETQTGQFPQSDSSSLPPAAPAAIRYYSTTVETLNSLRSDLVALNPDVQFSFRESVEPVYRQLVDLLLRDEQPASEQLLQARNVIESLQLAELDNFFRDACAQPEPTNVATLDANAAVVYPILLKNRLELIVQLPRAASAPSAKAVGADQAEPSLVHDRQLLPEQTFNQVARKLRSELDSDGYEPTFLGENDPSFQLFNWLIKPFAKELDLAAERPQSPVKTLVFVLDGPLRNLPMAVLFDGEHYLVERYAIAVTPGLQLLDPQPLERQSLNVLLGGAEAAPSFARENLGPLRGVPQELSSIKTTIPNGTLLKEQDFLQQQIQRLLEEIPFNIVHLATHGQFSSDPENTFILDWENRIVAQEFDDLLTVDDPNRAVENPVELLILSACKTAAGDDRAALGLAGIAIRAGARSTLATLWQVDDNATKEFMVQFYQELINPDVTKAEALRTVQLAFLAEDSDYWQPYFWAPFILVGNWL
jgi:CHAT domain-containing protein